jgi:hypothetical protein
MYERILYYLISINKTLYYATANTETFTFYLLFKINDDEDYSSTDKFNTEYDNKNESVIENKSINIQLTFPDNIRSNTMENEPLKNPTDASAISSIKTSAISSTKISADVVNDKLKTTPVTKQSIPVKNDINLKNSEKISKIAKYMLKYYIQIGLIITDNEESETLINQIKDSIK